MQVKRWLAAALLSGVAAVGAQERPVKLVLALDLGSGGDTINHLKYSDGSTQDLKAGDGVQLKLGLDYKVDEEWSVMGTIGYELAFTRGRNGNIYFERYPLELMFKYSVNDKVRVGFGGRLPLSPSVRATGAARSIQPDYDMKGKRSLVADVEYRVSPNFGLSARYVKDLYERDGKEVSGKHYAIGSNLYF